MLSGAYYAQNYATIIGWCLYIVAASECSVAARKLSK